MKQRFWKTYQQRKDEAVGQLTQYALTRFGRSKFARRSLNTIPTAVIANLLKAVVNFLFLYRVHTGVHWVDFCLSLLVCMVTAAISPLFHVLVQEREADLMRLSNHVADRLMLHGQVYWNQLQVKAISFLSALAIVYLWLVPVDSPMLIQTIVENLICFWVVGRVNDWRDSLWKPVEINVTREFHQVVQPHKLTSYHLVAVSHSNVRQATVVNPLQRAKVIPRGSGQRRQRRIFDDYCGKDL